MNETVVMNEAPPGTQSLNAKPRTLADLKPGQSATIANLKSTHLTIKLLEMGLLPGKEVVFNFSAPLGDPVSVQISGYNLSLRLDEARQIELV